MYKSSLNEGQAYGWQGGEAAQVLGEHRWKAGAASVLVYRNQEESQKEGRERMKLRMVTGWNPEDKEEPRKLW